MKAHVVAVAVIFMLSLAIAAFLIGFAEKSKSIVEEKQKEKFAKKIKPLLTRVIERGCEENTSYIAYFPYPVELSIEGSSFCLEGQCVELNCSYKDINYSLVKGNYLFNITKEDNSSSLKVVLWQ